MKKNILLVSLLMASGAAFSQSFLSVKNVSVERKGELVEVSFDAANAAKSFKANNTYTFTPSIVKGENRWAMPPMIFGSRRAKILNQRANTKIESFRHRGDTVRYRFTLPYDEWMAEGTLVMETTVKGCCRMQIGKPYLLSSNILPMPVVEPVKPEVVAPVMVASAGKQMADKYTFIAPISDFEGEHGNPLLNLNLPLQMGKSSDRIEQRKIEEYLNRHEEGALKIDFEVSKSVIDPDYQNNARSLIELTDAINAINKSSDSRVVRVVIAGFSSPEGTLQYNDRLSWNRALALKEFLIAHTSVNLTQLNLYNGSENWMGLRKLVEASNMKYKHEILRIIDNVPILKGRENQLMGLAGGEPYRYMLKNFFPQLRHAAYIRVYYEEKEAPQN